MKKWLLLLVMGVILIFGITMAVGAQDEIVCPSPIPTFHGFEADVQIGIGSVAYVGADLGLLSHGDLNLGIGFSLANINTRVFAGGYAKIGLYSFDFLKARCLVNPDTSEWSALIKAKLPLSLLFSSSNYWCPISVGVQYNESYLKTGCKSAYLQAYSFFWGLDVPFGNGLYEVWMEWQTWHNHKILLSCTSPRVINSEEPELEIGFSVCF